MGAVGALHSSGSTPHVVLIFTQMKNAYLLGAECFALILSLSLFWFFLRIEPIDGGLDVLLATLTGLISAALITAIYVTIQDSNQ